MQTFKQFKDFGIEPPPAYLEGKKITVEEILNLEIVIHSFDIKPSKYRGDCLYLQISLQDVKRIVFTTGQSLIIMIKKVPSDGFPIRTKIIKQEKRFIFINS